MWYSFTTLTLCFLPNVTLNLTGNLPDQITLPFFLLGLSTHCVDGWKAFGSKKGSSRLKG